MDYLPSLFTISNLKNWGVFVLVLLLYSAIFLGIHSQLGDIVASMSVVPIITIAWLQGKRAAVCAVIILYIWNIGMSLLLGNRPLALAGQVSNLVGTGMILIIGLMVGHMHTLTYKLKQEIDKRKELQDLLEEKNKLYASLREDNKKYQRRASADLDTPIATLKSELQGM